MQKKQAWGYDDTRVREYERRRGGECDNRKVGEHQSIIVIAIAIIIIIIVILIIIIVVIIIIIVIIIVIIIIITGLIGADIG